MSLCHTRRNRTDTRRANQLDANARARVNLLQIIDELRQILDGINIVMRRRGDQRNPRRRMAQFCNKFRDLKTGKLPAFAGLCALCHLDFQFFASTEIFRCYPKSARGDLFDRARGIVAVFIRLITFFLFSAFTGYSLCADPVHRNRECFMGFGRERTQRHSRRIKPFTHFCNSLDLINRDGLRRVVKFHQVAQVNGF